MAMVASSSTKRTAGMENFLEFEIGYQVIISIEGLRTMNDENGFDHRFGQQDGWQDQRSAIQATMLAIDENCEAHIASLDDALNLIAKAGIPFEKLDQQGEQRSLRHMVKRVVINPGRKILRLELRIPFSYLHELSANIV